MSQPIKNEMNWKAREAFADAERRIEVARWRNATTMDLANLGLTALPETLSQLTNLHELRLSNNRLTALPEALDRLASLQTLYLDGNQFSALPETLGHLTSLKVLCLDNNLLTALPEALGQLTGLRELILHSNRLTTLPESLGQLANLQSLYLDRNQLTTLPKTLRRLAKLERLSLHDNPALGLPSEVLGPGRFVVTLGGKRPRPPAEILDYYFRVHPLAAMARTMVEPVLEARPVAAPVLEMRPVAKPVLETRPVAKPVLEARPVATPVLETRPVAKPVLEARIIVVGDGASGKTSLVRQILRGQPAKLDEASTRDVVVEDWPGLTLSHPQSGERMPVSVHIWDFGGQKQMHAAHPYFFTTRTLYLVVAEARKDQQDRVEYWLKMVAKYGDTARAIVVVNKADGHAVAMDRPKLLDRHRKNLPEDASAAFFATSCTAGTGIAELKAGLVRELAAMPQVWALWPGEWFRVKECIAELRQAQIKTEFLRKMAEVSAWSRRSGDDGVDTMNYDEWRGICRQCDVTTDKDRDDLLENLGHLGHVVCFPRDARLSRLGVLNPDWVTRGIYPLLVERKIGEKGGLLEMSDLADLLPSDRYPRDRHPWLLDLMKAFELVFEDNQGQLLLPGQLPMDSPPWAQPAEWSDAGTLHLELRYHGVLPESVISQFIVRRHREARHPGEWWRHGIALRRDGCEALVRAHTTEQEAKIELRLLGPRQERRDFLSSIRETLRDPKDMLPPELHFILGPDCAPRYRDLLLFAAKKREHDFIVAGEVRTIRLAEILDLVESPAEQAASREAAEKLQHNQCNNCDMSTNNYYMTNSPGGNQGKGNKSSIKDSFNQQGTDPVALVAALRQSFAQLPPAQAAKVQEHVEAIEASVETIKAEQEKPQPRKGFLELTRKGLVEAAKTCGELAPPLLGTAKAVAEFFKQS